MLLLFNLLLLPFLFSKIAISFAFSFCSNNAKLLLLVRSLARGTDLFGAVGVVFCAECIKYFSNGETDVLGVARIVVTFSFTVPATGDDVAITFSHCVTIPAPVTGDDATIDSESLVCSIVPRGGDDLQLINSSEFWLLITVPVPTNGNDVTIIFSAV